MKVDEENLEANNYMMPLGVTLGIPKIFNDLDTSVYMFDLNYTNTNTQERIVIDTEKRSNIFRFMNHNEINPNTRVETHIYSGIEYPVVFAIRPIEIGDELTFDYGSRGPISAN